MQKFTNHFQSITELIEKVAYFQSIEDYTKMFSLLKDGLFADPLNYELYLQLGYYYLFGHANANQALLCFENALFHCHNRDDFSIIETLISDLKNNYQTNLNPISIVIISYNSCDILKDCIESIRKHNSVSSYELVIIDNASTDGIEKWLEQESTVCKDNLKIHLGKQNLGFGGGSNLGVTISSPANDILFLNNDTLVTENAIFWLRMALYQDSQIGAVGSYSNYPGNDQSVTVSFDSIPEYLEWAPQNNLPTDSLGQERIWLSGYAMLCRRNALDQIGLFDLDYQTGYYEDNDLSIRFLNHGYKLLACPNSFIYHYGSTSFKKNPEKTRQLLEKNCQLFKNKWNGIDLNDYCFPALNIITKINDRIKEDMISNPLLTKPSILEIGCKAGVTLSKLKYLYPKAHLTGIESNHDLAKLARVYHSVFTETPAAFFVSSSHKNYHFIYSETLFDLNFSDQINQYHDTANKLLKGIYNALQPNGYFICTTDLTFTPEQINSMLESNGFKVTVLNIIYSEKKEQDDTLSTPVPTKYIFVAKK